MVKNKFAKSQIGKQYTNLLTFTLSLYIICSHGITYYISVCLYNFFISHRYYLKGPKAGTMDIFADNLPGLPDNVRLSSSGGYWVAIAIVRRPDKISIYDFFASKPWLRKFITKVKFMYLAVYFQLSTTLNPWMICFKEILWVVGNLKLKVWRHFQKPNHQHNAWYT